MTARDLNPQLHIVARAAEEEAQAKLLRAGANHVVAPTIIGGHRMAVALTRPAVGEFFEAVVTNKLGLGFEQVEVSSDSSLVGKKLGSTPIASELDVVLVSIRRNDGEIIFNPAGETIIEDKDLLIAIGRAEALIELSQLAHGAV